MAEYALVLNAGSSSLKFSLYAQADGGWSLETKGQLEGIGTSPHLIAKDAGGKILLDEKPRSVIRDARHALEAIGSWIQSRNPASRLLAVGHRVVHGGSRYHSPTVVTPEVLAELRQLIPLAPLHQPYNLAAIDAITERFPSVPQVACFDTSFHRGSPAVAELVPLPEDIRRTGVQRYGFHGLSYEYIASALPRVAPEIAGGRVIVAHLGNGASMCALKNGRSVDNTLGFTALDGLCMGTRPGSLDPGVVLHLFQNMRLSAEEVESILYKQSGLLGISGISSDMRDLEKSDAPAAQLAIEYFVYRAAKEIGALAGVLGGLDGLVFTAGIGENSATIRRRICESSAWLGIELDPAANDRHGPRISTQSSKIGAWVIPTDEERMIVLHTGTLLGLTTGRN